MTGIRFSMAIVRGIRKLLKSDFKEAPAWFNKMLGPFNEFLDSVIGALRGKLTFRDNFYCEVKEFEFIHASELEIGHNLDDYKGILIVNTPSDQATATTYGISEWFVREIDNRTIGITIEFAGAGTTAGNVKFIILG